MRNETNIRLDQWRKLFEARRDTHSVSIVAFANLDREGFRFTANRCKMNRLFLDRETHPHLLSLFLR